MPHLRTIKPYNCVTAIALPDNRVELLPPLFDDGSTGTGEVTYAARLPQGMVEALVAYVEDRYEAPKDCRSQGNCHDFACFLAGFDAEYKIATKAVNNIFSSHIDMTATQDYLHIPLGDLVVIGHPNHIMTGPLVNGQRNSAYSSDGHGPLLVQHSAVSIGVVAETENSETTRKEVTHMLQRMALGGPLGITSLPDTLEEYKQFVPTLDWRYWMNGAPQADDLCAYSYPSHLLSYYLGLQQAC
jgi:hypothetical protein